VAAVDALLARGRAGAGGALVVRAAAGSVMPLDVVGAAAAAGLTVLAGRGRPSESALRFSTMLDVLGPVLGHVAGLPAVQADAIRGALGLGHGGPGDPFAVAVATLALLAAAAAEQPVALVVDDAQWIDDASLQTLEFVAHRVDAVAVAVVVVARRPDGDGRFAGLAQIALGGPVEVAVGRHRGEADRSVPGAVTCRTMGRFSVVEGRRRVRLPGLTGRLVAYLAVRAGPVDAEEVIDAFWPDDDFELSRARLRKVVWRIRRECDQLVVRHGDSLALSRAVDVDAHRFAEAADTALALGEAGRPAAGAAREALAGYGGELLPSFGYEDWIDGPRRAMVRRYVALQDLLVDDALERDDPVRAFTHLDQAIAADPYDESRYVRGAELLLAAGRRGPAAALLEQARRMSDELGVAPSAAVTDIVGRLRVG
jgi:DNA-binding SARP family transcriptional activator